MATTLTSSGITFSDGTQQTKRQGLIEGTPFTTNGAYTCTFSNIPTNHQKIVIDVEVGDSNGGPVYTTFSAKSSGGTSTFINDANAVTVASSGGTGTYTYGSILGSYTNYLSFSNTTRFILEFISQNPGSMPYYYAEIYSGNMRMIAAGTIYNTANPRIDTLSLGFSGGYTFANPKIGITWQ